jgi:hypothetical protein
LVERAAAEGGQVDARTTAGGGFRLAVDVPLNAGGGLQQ